MRDDVMPLDLSSISIIVCKSANAQVDNRGVGECKIVPSLGAIS